MLGHRNLGCIFCRIHNKKKNPQMNNSLGLLGTTIEHRSVFGAAWIALTAVRQFPADIGTYAESVQ